MNYIYPRGGLGQVRTWQRGERTMVPSYISNGLFITAILLTNRQREEGIHCGRVALTDLYHGLRLGVGVNKLLPTPSC